MVTRCRPCVKQTFDCSPAPVLTMVIPRQRPGFARFRDNRNVEEMGTTDVPELDPVVDLAMRDLTSFVYRRRRIYNLRIEKREKSLKDSGARAAAIHTFKHLRHGGHHFDPADIQSWALAHRWTAADAAELGDYAAGVLAGNRYHTDPDPLGPLPRRDWYASVIG